MFDHEMNWKLLDYSSAAYVDPSYSMYVKKVQPETKWR